MFGPMNLFTGLFSGAFMIGEQIHADAQVRMADAILGTPYTKEHLEVIKPLQRSLQRLNRETMKFDGPYYSELAHGDWSKVHEMKVEDARFLWEKAGLPQPSDFYANNAV